MTNQNASRTRRILVFGAAAAFVLLAGVAAVLLSGGDADTDAAQGTGGTATTAEAPGISEVRPVTVTGSALPPMPEQGNDPALGLAMPELNGQSFDGTPVEIRNDGRPKIILFLTHW